jgi:porin
VYKLIALVAAMVAFTGTTDANAQISQSAPTTAKTSGPDEQGRTADDGPISRFQKDNPLGNAVRALKEKGIAFDGAYVGNLAANPIGGVTHGFAESHWIDFSADLDLGKLIGLSNTHIYARAADFEGDSLAQTNVGNSISFQQTWRPVPGWRLTQLDVEHQFGRLKVIAGRSALNTYFGASPLNCVFMSNTACLTAYGPITAVGITAFPNSSWMGLANYRFSKKVYAQVGVFDYNNDLNLPGKGGTDFSFFKGTGKLIAAETGYETSFANDRYPRRYRIGVDINTDGGTSPLYDKNGQPAGISGLTRATQTGTRVGIYALGDQTILRPNSKSPRNLAVFGRIFYNAGAKSTIDWFASAGFVKTGTFKGRDNDTAGFIVSNTHFSDDEVEYLRELRAKAGGAGTPPRDEIIGEVNYGFAAASGVRLLPNVQYVINPDPINATKYFRDIPSAVVVGLRIDVRFAQLLTGSQR